MKALNFSSRAATRWSDNDLEPIARAHDLRGGLEVLSWVLIVAAFFVGAVARLLTIDRGTPSIGAFIHVIMMAAVFLLIALPAGVAAGMGSALLARRWPDSVKWAPLCAGFASASAVWIFLHLGRHSPAWHVVWPTMVWAALLACKVLPLGVRTVEALRSGAKS
jgi:hypothetical protein